MKNSERVALNPTAQYKEVTVRLWGKGVVLRGVCNGSDIASDSRVRVRAGQFIMSRIDARNGAFGIVPQELDGAVVTGDFPTFVVQEQRLLPAFLGWFAKTQRFVDVCRAASEGTTNRVRLKEEEFLRARVPIPPLAEQHAIASHLSCLQQRVDEAALLSAEGIRAMRNVPRAMLFAATGRRIALRQLVRRRSLDVEVQADATYQFAGVYCFGRGVFRGKQQRGSDFAYARLCTLHAGDFVYPKLMAWEGALGVVPPDCDGCVVSPEFPVFEIDSATVLPELLDVYFRSPSVWPQLSGASTGTNVRRRRLNPEDFLRHEMPVPDMNTQERIREVASRSTEAIREAEARLARIQAVIPARLRQVFEQAPVVAATL